ncbi:MAG TPA: glycosyltransferase family 4 protein [Anaerolineales bacterium]|nr:glycosyltransferase family 4 protein [Anaerolineales bacterium]
MKILLINSEYPPIGGGAGNASANIARLLAQRGCEVTVMTSAWDGLPVRALQEGVKLLRVRSLRRHADRSTAWEQISFILAASLHARHLARQPRPDVTLAFFGLPSGAVALLLRRLYGIPYVVSLRGGDVPGFRPYDFRFYHRLAAPLLHRIWRGAASIVANSRGLQELALAFDSHYEIPVIPNGVDAVRFTVSQRDWSPPHILSVGRVVYQKGLDLAMRALSQLKDQEWMWTIAGDGPQMPMLKTMAREYGIQERVHFQGWLSQEQLKVQYAAANLFLFPSRHEGMPNAVLEAMASSLPVVATRISGSDELVVEGETGRLIPSEDVDALRGALRVLVGDAAQRERMGHAARQRVERSFTWTRVAEQYEAILRKSTEWSKGSREPA